MTRFVLEFHSFGDLLAAASPRSNFLGMTKSNSAGTVIEEAPMVHFCMEDTKSPFLKFPEQVFHSYFCETVRGGEFKKIRTNIFESSNTTSSESESPHQSSDQ